MVWKSHILAILVAASLATPLARAAEASSAGIDLFEKKIRPVLVSECYRCHSAQAEKLKGGLLLDSRQAMLTGGDSGAASVPGDPAKSLLVKAIRGDGKDLSMPPQQQLRAELVADFAQWVKRGPPWPAESAND